MFKKSFWAMQQDLKHGNKLLFSIFGGQSITNRDKQAILDYNTLLQKGVKPGKAWAMTMSKCSIAAQNQTRECLKAKGSLTELANGLKTTTLSAKAAELGMKALSIAANMALSMGIMLGISEGISLLYEFSQASKKAAENAQELGAAFKETKSDIEDYKTRIEELYTTITDSSSSVSDVTDARKSLMSIQDEMIEKYGAEKGVIEAITGVMNGQTDAVDNLSDALDNLIQKQWQETKNELNKGGDTVKERFVNNVANAIHGYKDNIERMESEYGDYTAKINLSRTGMDASELEELMETLRTVYGAKITTFYDGSLMAEFNGNATEIYNTLYEIQDLSDRFNFSDNLEKQLTNAVNLAKDLTDQYSDIFDQYVLNDKIFANEDYKKTYKDLMESYGKYSDAMLSGDEEKIKEKSGKYVKLLSESLQNVKDEDVADFFKNMYPDLKDEFAGYEIKLNFNANTDGLKNSVQDALYKLGNKSTEEIVGLNLSIASDEEIQGYDELDAIAQEYGMDLEWLLSLLEEMGEVQSESYKQLVDTFGAKNIKKLTTKDLEIAYTIDNVGDMTFEEFQAEIEELKRLPEEDTSFSFRFQTLWDSETFSDAKADLMKLAKESKITEEDIQSLAKENSELASLLNESGISAQFAAACFNRVSDGTDGFSAITEDALALDKALHGMDESLQNVAASKSAYDKAMEQDDYNAEFKDYQEAYEQAMEMFENGEYGKHFQSSMLYLLGDDAVNMSIEEMKSAMDKLKSVFGENATNGLEFLDKLYEKRDILDGMSSSLEKLEDGSYKFDLKPEEFEQIADALGMTTEQVAACTNALGMFGDYASYDIDKVNNALSEMSIAVKDGEDSILSLQSVKDMLSNMGYDEWDIVKIMQDIQEMGNIKLIDFSASDAESIKSAVSYLQQLEMIEIDGSNINVDSLIEHLRNELGMLPEEIKGFLTNLDVDYDFSDTEGNIIALDKAFEKVDEQEMKSVTGEIEETDEAIQNATVSADGLKDVLDDISHLSLESLRSQVIGVKDAIGEVREAAKTASSVLGNLSGNITLASDGGTSGNGAPKGTLKGKVNAAGNFNITKKGTAKASGDIGAKKTETSLINELGNETIIDPKSGTYEIVQGGAQFRKIRKGQIILNHLQTKALLAKGKISSFGKMMFGGNAALKGHSYAVGTAGGTNSATGKPFSGNGSNSSTSKKSSTNSDADSISDSAKESLETFNFIEIAISRIEDAIDKLKEKAEETFRSFTNRGKAYSESIAKITEEISLQEKARDAYMARANSYGLDEAWAEQVRKGSINIADISDDALKEQINGYQEW